MPKRLRPLFTISAPCSPESREIDGFRLDRNEIEEEIIDAVNDLRLANWCVISHKNMPLCLDENPTISELAIACEGVSKHGAAYIIYCDNVSDSPSIPTATNFEAAFVGVYDSEEEFAKAQFLKFYPTISSKVYETIGDVIDYQKFLKKLNGYGGFILVHRNNKKYAYRRPA